MPRTADALALKTKLFRGLSAPNRLAILEALRRGPRNVSQVVALTGLSQPNASTHLNCLWCCGIVDREVRGRFTVYRIKPKKIVRILEAADEVLADVADRIAECERYEERRP